MALPAMKVPRTGFYDTGEHSSEHFQGSVDQVEIHMPLAKPRSVECPQTCRGISGSLVFVRDTAGCSANCAMKSP